MSNGSSDYFLFEKCGIVDQLKAKMKHDKSVVNQQAKDANDPLMHYNFIDTFNRWAFSQLFLPIGDKVRASMHYSKYVVCIKSN